MSNTSTKRTLSGKSRKKSTRKGAKDSTPQPSTATETWQQINQGISDTMQHFAIFTNKLRDGSFINEGVLAKMDARYDSEGGAEPLTDEQLQALGRHIAAEGDPEAVILLMDEIERSRHLPMQIGEIVYCVILGAGEMDAAEASAGRRVQKRIRSASALKQMRHFLPPCKEGAQ